MRTSWWSEIGGSSALNRWTLIVLFPIGMVLHLTSGLTALVWVSWRDVVAVVVGQLAAATIGFVVWWGFFGPRWSKPRPLLAVVTFGVIGVVRAVGIDSTLVFISGEPGYSPLSRAILGVAIGLIACGLVAVLVGVSRRARDTLARLSRAEHSIRVLDEQLTSTYEALETDVLKQAGEALDRAGTEMAGSPTREHVVAVFDSLNRDVFRPLSQRLVHHLPHTETPRSGMEGRFPGTAWRQSLTSLLPPDWRVVSPLLALIVLLFYLRGFGILPGVAMTALLLMVVVPLLWLVGRLLGYRAPLSPGQGFAGLLGYGLIGLVGMVVVAIASGVVTGQVLLSWSALVIIPGLALGTSLTMTRQRDLSELEQSLARTLTEVSSLTQRAQQGIDQKRERLVHLLHADIQGGLVAEILRLKTRGEKSGHPKQFLTELRGRLDSFHEGSDASPGEDTEVVIRRLIRLWQSATAIRPSLEREAIDALNTDPRRAKAVVDVLSEALTNAVRHGEVGVIDVSVSTAGPHTIRLTVTNPGTLPAPAGFGLVGTKAESIGLGRIRALTSRHTISQKGPSVILVTEFDEVARPHPVDAGQAIG